MTPVSETERKPVEAGTFTMYLADKWYLCKIPKNKIPEDPVESLDVSLLQELLLTPVLGIGDPKTDPRIDFVGGIRGLSELENVVTKMRMWHLPCIRLRSPSCSR